VARVSVKLPVGAVTASGLTEVAVEAGIRPRVYRDDGRMYAGVFVGGRNIKAVGGLDAELKDGDALQIVPPISGG